MSVSDRDRSRAYIVNVEGIGLREDGGLRDPKQSEVTQAWSSSHKHTHFELNSLTWYSFISSIHYSNLSGRGIAPIDFIITKMSESIQSSSNKNSNLLSSQSSLLHTQTQSTSKSSLLNMIHVVRDSLNCAWTVKVQTKTRQKRLKQLLALEERVAAMDESCVETVFLHHAARSCLPGIGFGSGSYKRKAKRHVSSAIQFLDISTNNLRSDMATIGGEDDEVVRCSIELDGFCLSSFQEGEEEMKDEEGEDTDNDTDDEDEDVTVITSNFHTTEDEDIGVSVTTWRRHSGAASSIINNNTSAVDDENLNQNVRTKHPPKTGILKRRQFASGCGSDSALGRFEKDENTDDESDDGKSDDDNDDGTIEEIVVSMGDIVVRATRSKRVRFSGVKPTMEENLTRANELLRRAKAKSTCSFGSSTRAVCGDQ